jgi:hypothetical protein
VVNDASEYHFNVPPLPTAFNVTVPDPHRLAPLATGAAVFIVKVAALLATLAPHTLLNRARYSLPLSAATAVNV